MTPAERRAQELERSSFLADPYSAALIRRLAAALTEFHAAYKAGGWAKDGIEDRHADALRDVKEEP